MMKNLFTFQLEMVTILRLFEEFYKKQETTFGMKQVWNAVILDGSLNQYVMSLKNRKKIVK